MSPIVQITDRAGQHSFFTVQKLLYPRKKEEVGSIGPVDQMVNPTEVSMHAIHVSDLIGQLLLFESIQELKIELLNAT